jgi:D-alanyl-lipoteichoic acid acyltransferase DltB (MBOAT superfamily)
MCSAAKYDVAISTAATAGLNYIVVETINSAQACIELLRRRNREETVTCLILVTLYCLLHLCVILIEILPYIFIVGIGHYIFYRKSKHTFSKKVKQKFKLLKEFHDSLIW